MDVETCCICGRSGPPAERARVRSNVRRLAEWTYSIWRCAACRSIHAGEPVDLEEAYREYPFFRQKVDWSLRYAYRGLLRRLRRLGLRANHRTIDYGCGSGHLVDFLNRSGLQVCGYDPYSPTHGDRRVLEGQYDFVLAQDVVEHDPDPMTVLDRLDSLARSGGVIVIGTPNAGGIDLSRAGQFRHPLHQPFHRHIFDVGALQSAGETRGWEKMRYFPTPYTNMPGLSLPMMHHYMDQFDGTIDVLFDRPVNLKMWIQPRTWRMLLEGFFRCDDADIVIAFRKNLRK